MIDLIEQHRAALEGLCRRYRVKTLEVFGSAADGTFDPARSDLLDRCRGVGDTSFHSPVRPLAMPPDSLTSNQQPPFRDPAWRHSPLLGGLEGALSDLSHLVAGEGIDEPHISRTLVRGEKSSHVVLQLLDFRLTLSPDGATLFRRPPGDGGLRHPDVGPVRGGIP